MLDNVYVSEINIRLKKANPLPTRKIKNDYMNDTARYWSFLDRWNFLFKEGHLCYKLLKNSSLETKYRISEIHLQR